MPTFENGWICRKCWCANRETDSRCYRCHAVPEPRVAPEPVTFSTPDEKPNEERRKVSSLVGEQVARAAEPAAPAPTLPRIPLSERIREMVFVVRARAAIAALTAGVQCLLSFGRAVGHAPGAGVRLASQGAKGARSRAGTGARSVLLHRRVWLSAAWAISALSCALLFSAALHAPFAASLLVVMSVAIFSGLTAAITTSLSERAAHGMTERPGEMHPAVDHSAAFVAPPEHASAQTPKVLGSRPAP